MIDTASREKLREANKTKELINGMKDSLLDAMEKKEDPDVEALMGAPFKEVLRLAAKKEGEKELLNQVGKIGQALAIIYKAISRPITLPKIFQIKGSVEVTRTAPTRITNLNELERYFKSLEQKIITLAQASSTAPPPQIKMPEFPKIQIPKVDNSKLEELIESLNEKISKINVKETKFPKEIQVSNFPQQYIPTPVTNININPLQGQIKTTSDTVGTTLTTLPSYGRLFNRRSMIIYNNSANTIFVGGSDVTTSNGIPVSSGNFSPVFDAGYNQIVYGIAASGDNNVRVMEVASTSVGGVAIQE